MRTILAIILFIICVAVYADNAPLRYETDFEMNEEMLISSNALMSKQEVKELVAFGVFSYPNKFSEKEKKQIIENMEVILVENITDPGYPYDERIKRHSFYYVAHTLLPDGKMYALDCYNAETKKFMVGFAPDYKNEREHQNYLLSRREVIEYVKKYFDFSEDSLKIRAVFDHRFELGTAIDEPYWRYEITLEQGTFTSPEITYSVDVIFVDPYVVRVNNKKDEPGPTNVMMAFVNHRLFALSSGTKRNADLEKNKYVGVDK